MSHPHELAIPQKAKADLNGRELLRAWGAAGGLHVSLAAEIWPDARNWGIALADVIRHLGDAYRQTQSADPDETAKKILKVLLAEFESPTDKPKGKVR